MLTVHGTPRRTWFLWTVIAGAVLAPVARAEDCVRQCREEMAACVAQRCAGLTGRARTTCRDECRALGSCVRVGTLAYALSECRTDANGTTVRQSLVVRRGNCPPVTVVEFPFGPPIPEPLGLCKIWGDVRNGSASVLAGAIHRLAVSPDGTAVVFEVTSDQALFSLIPVPVEQSGIYYVRADGTGLRRLAPPSRLATYEYYPNPRITGLGIDFYFSLVPLAFTPDGRRIAFQDLGPGDDGKEAPQVVMVDVASGQRTQITRLPAPPSSAGSDVNVRFVGHTKIGFASSANAGGLNPGGEVRVFTIGLDGTDLAMVPPPVSPAGATVEATFQMVGGRRLRATSFDLPGTPVNIPSVPDIERPITEAFVFDGTRLLQLTNFRRTDTRGRTQSRQARRIFIAASADPFGTNPSENCQIFSIDPLGRHLRQLTRFQEAAHSTAGCYSLPEPGCNIWNIREDPATGGVIFYSSCDPFGAGYFGGQLFAMRPSGARLRQLTRTRGMIREADGTLRVELPGPWALAGRP